MNMATICDINVVNVTWSYFDLLEMCVLPLLVNVMNIIMSDFCIMTMSDKNVNYEKLCQLKERNRVNYMRETDYFHC